MKISEIYKNAKKATGTLYYEIPFKRPMSAKMTPNGIEQIGGDIETIVVLNPNMKDDLMRVINYLSDGDNLTQEKARLDAIYTEKRKAVKSAEINAEDLFEETDVIFEGQTLYRRIK